MHIKKFNICLSIVSFTFKFIFKYSECDLEVLLTNYTRRNKSTGLFFGVRSEKKEIKYSFYFAVLISGF